MDIILISLAAIASVAFGGFLVLMYFDRRRKNQRDQEYWQHVEAAAKKRLDHIMDQTE